MTSRVHLLAWSRLRYVFNSRMSQCQGSRGPSGQGGVDRVREVRVTRRREVRDGPGTRGRVAWTNKIHDSRMSHNIWQSRYREAHRRRHPVRTEPYRSAFFSFSARRLALGSRPIATRESARVPTPFETSVVTSWHFASRTRQSSLHSSTSASPSPAGPPAHGQFRH